MPSDSEQTVPQILSSFKDEGLFKPKVNLKSKLQEYVMQNLQINSPNSKLIAQSFVTSFLHN